MTLSVKWTDSFTHDYFADSTYMNNQDMPMGGDFGFSVSGGHLTLPWNSVVEWWDTRHHLELGFSTARVWADIEQIHDLGQAQVLVGFAGFPVFASLSIGPSSGFVEDNNDGVSGGPIRSGGDYLELNCNYGESRPSGFPTRLGPDAVARAPLTSGRVQLTLSGLGPLSVTTPDGAVNSMTVPSGVLSYWLSRRQVGGAFQGIFPMCIAAGSQTTSSDPPLILSEWGYEIDYPVVPPPETGLIKPGTMKGGAVRLQTMGNPLGVPLSRIP